MKIKIDPTPGRTVEFLGYDIEIDTIKIMNARSRDCSWDEAHSEAINRRVAIVVRETPFTWVEVE